MNKENFESLNTRTIKDLRTMCTELSIPIKSNMVKKELIQLIISHKPSVVKSKSSKTTLKQESKPPTSESVSRKTNKRPVRCSDCVDTQPTQAKTCMKSGKLSTTNAKEEIKRTPDKKYIILEQLGVKGKEGTTFLVKNKKGELYAMKTFSKQKSENAIMREATHQKQVARHGLAPVVRDINTTHKYIVMDKLDKNLFDIVKKNNGNIPDAIQRKIVGLIKKMDETGVFHGDPNPANFMMKGNIMYMIDYGFSRDIDDKLVKKHQTNTPNSKFMIIGLILKLKDIYREHNGNIEYKVLSKTLNC